MEFVRESKRCCIEFLGKRSCSDDENLTSRTRARAEDSHGTEERCVCGLAGCAAVLEVYGAFRDGRSEVGFLEAGARIDAGVIRDRCKTKLKYETRTGGCAVRIEAVDEDERVTQQEVEFVCRSTARKHDPRQPREQERIDG